MKLIGITIGIFSISLLSATVKSETPGLRAEFIGNCAFRITDGTATLFTDFPYRSGAFDYMDYDSSRLTATDPSYCLFTHAHADHFEPSLLNAIGCNVIGPESILKETANAHTTALQKEIVLPYFKIIPVKTAHGQDHFSYLVEWQGKRLYFTGDTESTAELSLQPKLDVLFITPWLYSAAQSAGKLPEARQIIIYHHRTGEKVECMNCIVPLQNQTFDFQGPH